MKKILIIHASAGNGHKTAAKALKEAFEELYSQQVTIKLVDALEYSNLIYKESYSKSYWAMTNYAPKLWGLLYKKTDQKNKKSLSKKIVSTFDQLNTIKLNSLVDEYKPDHIISTHYLPADVLTKSKKIEHSVVVTDYEIHSYWIRENVNQYFVASEMTKLMLHYRSQMPLNKIHDFGIPVSARFSKKLNKNFIKSIGLNPKHKTILVYGEGVWTQGLMEYIASFHKIKHSLNIIFLAGKNEKLKTLLEETSFPKNINKHVIGFVTDIENYINISDLIITKPGGLIVSECLAMNKAMLLILPIPGQEDANSDFLTEHGAAMRAKDPISFQSKLEILLQNPEKLTLLKNNAKKISKPLAAKNIAKYIAKEQLKL